MSKSSNSIISSVFTLKEQQSKKRPDTAITQFKNSLNNLMVILMDKEPSYIRCIKPNDTKQPGMFETSMANLCIIKLNYFRNIRPEISKTSSHVLRLNGKFKSPTSWIRL